MTKNNIKKNIGMILFVVGIAYMFYLVNKKSSNQRIIDAAKENTYAPRN